MTPRWNRRAFGWVALYGVALVGIAASILGNWAVVAAMLTLLSGANVAMTYDDRARSARILKVIRAGVREHQTLKAAIGKLSRDAAPLDQAVSDARARDRRLLGILEAERQIAEARSRDISRAIESLERIIASSAVNTAAGADPITSSEYGEPEGDPQ